jgi:hypothetical protein
VVFPVEVAVAVETDTDEDVPAPPKPPAPLVSTRFCHGIGQHGAEQAAFGSLQVHISLPLTLHEQLPRLSQSTE